MERPMSLEKNKQVALESLRAIQTGDTAAAERIVWISSIGRRMTIPIDRIADSEARRA
jgi:hypothetical protein